MDSNYDVVIIGAGISGAAAALAAARNGARVCVLTGAPAATAMFSGAWRGPCPDSLRGALAASGYELGESKHPLPHPMGTFLQGSFAVRSHNDAELSSSALICGIAGLAGFDAAGLALQWSARTGVELSSATLLLDDTPAAGWSTASLAAQLEHNSSSFSNALRAAADQHAAKRVVVPAVLGVSHTDEVHQRVHKECGLQVGEALGAAPSLPGWRLYHALRDMLAAAAVPVIEARVTSFTRQDGGVASVTTAAQTIHGEQFILASGKFASGGIEAGALFRESVFDCPVWVEHLGENFDGPDPLILTDPERIEDQPLLRAGVHGDADGRPVNQTNDVVYKNVFIAGSIRAGWDHTQGVGDAAEDGWRAGMKASSA